MDENDGVPCVSDHFSSDALEDVFAAKDGISVFGGVSVFVGRQSFRCYENFVIVQIFAGHFGHAKTQIRQSVLAELPTKVIRCRISVGFTIRAKIHFDHALPRAAISNISNFKESVGSVGC